MSAWRGWAVLVLPVFTASGPAGLASDATEPQPSPISCMVRRRPRLAGRSRRPRFLGETFGFSEGEAFLQGIVHQAKVATIKRSRTSANSSSLSASGGVSSGP